jgi:hypothetical protein
MNEESTRPNGSTPHTSFRRRRNEEGVQRGRQDQEGSVQDGQGPQEARRHSHTTQKMNPYFLLGAILAVSIAGGAGYYKGDEAGQAKVLAEWNIEKARLAEEYAKNLEAQREKEREAQIAADKTREQKDHEIREANARNTALVNSLRDRPERPKDGGVSQTAGACSAATGAQLARGDGEFLARYSSDAARLQSELAHCVAQYNQIKKILNKEN